MDTINKLREAKYFLEAVTKTKTTQKRLFIYNLSAFLSAWRSVLDVMLYDFAVHYCIGLTRADRVLPHDFWIVAKAQNNTQALEFFKWWNKKRGELSNNPLWNMRHIIVHRGYPEITHRLYVPASSSSGGTGFILNIEAIPEGILLPASNTYVDIDFPDLLDMCKKGYALMVSIVMEAREKFGVEL